MAAAGRDRLFAEAVMESLPGLFFVLDAAGRLVRWNRLAEGLTGRTAAALAGQDPLLLIHEEDRPLAREALDAGFDQGHGEAEVRAVHRDGSVRHLYLTGWRITIDEEPFLVVSGIDVTARREADRALRSAKEYAENLIATANAMVVGLDRDGNIRVFNQAAQAVTGYTREELEGRDWFEAVVPRDRYPQVWAEFERLTRGGFPHEFENPILTKSGEERYVVWRNSPVMEDGNIVGTISFGIDITQRRRDEEMLLSLAAAVEQAADDILLLDPEGRIRYANAAFERSTGYLREEVQGRTPHFLDCGAHSPEFYAEIERTVASGRTWTGRFRNRTKDGRIILQDASISPIRDAAGRIVGQVSARRDVTRQVETEERARQAHKLQAMGTLAGGIAHDFNNILSAIMGYAQMAMMKSAGNPAVRHDLEAVLQASTRAADLVRQILAFSRHHQPETRPVQVGLIVKEALRFLRASIPATVEIRGEVRSTASVMADPTDIHRVVINLCTNGALAIPEGGGVLAVCVEDVDLDAAFAAIHPEVSPGRFVRLTVSDTGCGMSPDVLARIFEPFFTTRDKGQGTGMGLAVVHGIVQSCHGAVTVESEPGRGSRFQVYLPALLGPAPVAHVHGEDVEGGTERVLVVDDESLVAGAMSGMLESLGYRIRACRSADEALSVLEADPGGVDLVITDLTMPGMTGDVLAQWLKRLRPELPVILCTGYGNRMPPDEARARGVDALLLKPVALADLARAVRRALDQPRG